VIFALALSALVSLVSLGPLVPPGRLAPPPVTWAATVAVIFARDCVPCHGPRRSPSGLRLDDYALAMRGGDGGPAILPGNAQDSPLIQKLEHRDRPVMPPRKRLPHATIAILRAWIDAGAPP
jgi:mono/diheme cytochrome c family protein